MGVAPELLRCLTQPARICPLPCRSLLVVLNPNSGHRRAPSLYRRVVAPLFAAAGIRAAVRETQRPGHAHDMVAQLTARELDGIDGALGSPGRGQRGKSGCCCCRRCRCCLLLQALQPLQCCTVLLPHLP